MSETIEAVVLGRLHADLYPQQVGVPLEAARTFERFVGGFAGNVGTGLARLGVRTAVVSSVGDDGHGRFIRQFLIDEGVDITSVSTHPTARTPLTFCEIRPPADFPLLAYRPPDSPDWQLQPDDVPIDLVRSAPLVLASATALAVEPSRSTTLGVLAARRKAPGGTIILDLDWRAQYWAPADDYGPQTRAAMLLADVLVGSDQEFDAAGVTPLEALANGARRVFVKHGPNGATLLTAGERSDVPGLQVKVLNGLGSGDAFAATAGWGILRGLDDATILRFANVAGAIVAERMACSGAMPSADELADRAALS